ncbi:hypothetical protein ACE0DR_16040 [Azotobacter sp. CWF10]
MIEYALAIAAGMATILSPASCPSCRSCWRPAPAAGEPGRCG